MTDMNSKMMTRCYWCVWLERRGTPTLSAIAMDAPAGVEISRLARCWPFTHLEQRRVLRLTSHASFSIKVGSRALSQRRDQTRRWEVSKNVHRRWTKENKRGDSTGRRNNKQIKRTKPNTRVCLSCLGRRQVERQRERKDGAGRHSGGGRVAFCLVCVCGGRRGQNVHDECCVGMRLKWWW